MIAMIHIQNTAPGPPRVIATATPATLPVPTRDAAEMVKALNGEIPLSGAFFLFFFVPALPTAAESASSCSPSRSISSSYGGSATAPNICGSSRS